MLQKNALDTMKLGVNVFLTGSAGTGKSYTVGKYIEYLKESKVKGVQVAITATTGIAATNIGGTTIHSFSCIGIKEDMSDSEIMKLLMRRKKRVAALLDADVLLIDEISMLHLKAFNLANKVISLARKDSRPFGGLQVIVIGDFFQLPPVPKNNELEQSRDRFAFMSQTWVDCKFQVCYLTEQFRTTSSDLNHILNAIREDNVQDSHLDIIKSRMIKPENTQILNLFTHNENVDLINYTQLQKVEGATYRYEADLDGNMDRAKSLLNSITAVQKLELKVGAKVMFVKNDPDSGYMNGTQGEIIKFIKDEEHDPPFIPVVKTKEGAIITAEPTTWEDEENERVVASVKQIPLRLAWAITIHKSQGMSLDEANINLNRVFEDGQGFVALSRLKTLEGLYVEDFSMRALRLNPLARKADVRFQELSAEVETELSKYPEKELEKLHKAFIKKLLRQK